MKKIVLITLIALTNQAFSQGRIDLDTDIQMGVAGTEHLKLTDSSFSVHQDPINPLISADFGTGNVGIGILTATNRFEVHSTTQNTGLKVSNSFGSTGRSRVNLVISDRTWRIDNDGNIDLFRIRDVTAGSDRLTIDYNGNIDVYGPLRVTNESSYGPVQLRSWGLYNPSGSGNIYIEPKPGSTFSVVPHDWSQNLTSVFYGNVNVHGSINQVSDQRLKKNIREVSDASNKLKRIRGVRFEWEKSDKTDVGILAQEVEAVFPELVQEVEVIRNTETQETEVFKSVNYAGLIAPMIESIKELHSLVEAQAHEITQLKNQINSLKEE